MYGNLLSLQLAPLKGQHDEVQGEVLGLSGCGFPGSVKVSEDDEPDIRAKS